MSQLSPRGAGRGDLPWNFALRLTDVHLMLFMAGPKRNGYKLSITRLVKNSKGLKCRGMANSRIS